MTVPVAVENYRDKDIENDQEDEDSGTTRKSRHRAPPSPFSLLLHIDGNGYHDVKSVSWLPTLRVNSKHEFLQILSRKNGVTFSVDPVVPNLSRLPVVSDSAWRTAFQPNPTEGYQEWIAGNWGARPLVDLHVQRHAFLDAFVMAWNEHRAVRLSPDAVWMFLLEGLLTTTRKDSKSVRGEMVLHDTGKVRLEAQLNEDFPSRIHQSAAWENVASQLLDSMDRHTVDHRQQKLQPHFSTTTPSRALATKIRILELYQDYFEYTGAVGCGIPSIHLEGSPSDWKLLRSQVKALSINSTRTWVDGVIPILDQFVAASEGKPDGKFWKAFVRFRAREPECGSVDELDGWITRLVKRPAFKSDDSTDVPPKWDERLELSYLQRDHGSVPFLLRIGREERHFQFVSGFSGVRQDPDGALAPELGWAVWETKNEATSPEGKP